MELNDVLGRIRVAGLLFLSILMVGTLVYKLMDPNATLLDSFYMTAITVATIGFHEVVDLADHPGGRLFTILLAFSGIGIITYFFSNLAALFIEGDLRRAFQRRQMEKKIKNLEAHFIICGCGRVGRNIALELHATKRPYVLADHELEVIEKLIVDERLEGALFLAGDCTDDDFLIQLGVKRALGIFATTGDDNTNLVTTLSARVLNPAIKIVSLAKDLSHMKKIKKAGATKVVSPAFIGGMRMASEMIRPQVTTFLDDMLRSSFNQRLEEITIPMSAQGKQIQELQIDRLKETVVLAIHENDSWLYNPPTDYSLQGGSHVIIMTTPDERLELERKLS
ncbi:MAG: potassium channel protein [Bacteroidota bacterium]